MIFGEGTKERDVMVGKNGWQGGTSEMAAAPAHAHAHATRLLKIAFAEVDCTTFDLRTPTTHTLHASHSSASDTFLE